MELRPRRSTRSRSKTPFTTDIYSEQTIEGGGGHIEESVVRTTRRTTIYKTNDNAISSSEEFLSSESSKPFRSRTANASSETTIRSFGHKTSDYSSEEGESEVSSSRVISQNDKNQIIEDALAAANGRTEVSALDLYRKAGRYWEKYPKTDWTYSPHSRDRVELAPGVVQMPNMSRRTIHSYCGDFASKATNTESYLDETDYISSRKSENYISRVMPTKLFSNNNYKESYVSRSRASYSRQSYFSRVTSVFVTIYTTILSFFHYLYQLEHSWLLWIGKKVHRLASKVMLLDTWLLKKSSYPNKTRAVLALCLLPLLLLGGWWILSGLGYTLYGAVSKTSQAVFESTINFDNFLFGKSVDTSEDFNTIEPKLPPSVNLESSSSDFGSRQTRNIEERVIRITEKIFVEPPKASEVAAGLTSDQLKEIAASISTFATSNDNKQVNIDEIIERILLTPSLQNIINNYNNINIAKSTDDKVDINIVHKQQKIIGDLESEIAKIKEELLEMEKIRNMDMYKINTQFESEMARNAKLAFQINRCCRRNIINIENYVHRIVHDLLSDPEFLNAHMSDWLRTMFVAKQDLEFHLSNMTSRLDSKYDSLIEDNGRIIMDQVAAKIKAQINEQIQNLDITHKKTEYKSEISLGSVTDEHIREIVKNTLAIYDADKTGLVDYAMEPMGGQVLTTRCTESYHAGTAVVSILGIPLWYPTNSPRTVITPGINPGECWAFQNFPGFLIIKLATTIKIEAFSLEHISKLLVPNGKIDSAPKEFEIYGLTNENDKDPILIGRYEYDYDGESLQYFAAQNQNHSLVFDMVELRIISNHGNPNYTCLYRFRVHGKLANEAT